MGIAGQLQLQEASRDRENFRSLLAAIKQVHEQLASEMTKMDALTSEPRPDRLRYAQLRWKLSHSSLARRSLSAKICLKLMPHLLAGEMNTISEVQAADRELAGQSARHIGRWSVEEIDRQWGEYCRASREIRRHMAAFLEMEERLLFPILSRAASFESRRGDARGWRE